MRIYENPIKAKLINNISHQNIGGKEIIIERQFTLDYFLDKNFRDMTIAEMNFVNRKMDLFIENSDDECKDIVCYYGHVGNLGYFVSEDELITCPNCKKPIIGIPAISRKDNKTEICSECGQNEALEAFNEYWRLK